MIPSQPPTRRAATDPGSSRTSAKTDDHNAAAASSASVSSRSTGLADPSLESLGSPPKPDAREGATSQESSCAEPSRIDIRVRSELHAERHRVGWTQATETTERLGHKIQSILGLRNSNARTQAFIEFMASGRGQPDATMLDLGDGWTRATRRVGGKTACIDFLTDGSGAVVDARYPGQRPSLPLGKERDAFRTALQEVKSVGVEALRKVPVYYVNRNTRGYALPTHGYVVAGDPGKGRKSGAILYGVGGDPKRGPVILDDSMLKRLLDKSGGKGSDKLPEAARAAISRLAGESFASREDFYAAYSRTRGDSSDPASLHEEISSIYRLLPMSTMELWPKKADDYRVAKPAAPERDLRAFENLPKDIGHKVSLRQISDVDSTALLEARQQFDLHRLYQDELLGRNGTGVPSELFPPLADVERRSSLSVATPRFQRLPPHTSDKVGNCNTGAASLLQRAIDNNQRPGTSASQKVTAASIFGVGSGHRVALWDPLRPRESAADRLPTQREADRHAVDRSMS